MLHWVDNTSPASAAAIVPVIVDAIAPKSVLDVGCGYGVWLAEFENHGVTDVVGLDASYVEKKRLAISSSNYRATDLTRPIQLDRTFDLALCLEVGEHLPEAAGPGLVQTLANAAPVVVFSAAIPGQDGIGHINEQWPDYWHSLFGKHGFVAIDYLRSLFWHDQRIAPWYRQNTFVLVRENAIASYPLLQAEKAHGVMPIRVVHPDLFARMARRALPENHSPRRLLGALPSAARASLTRLTPSRNSGLRGLYWRYRASTAMLRALPDYLIIGAQKAGTSSLHRYVAQHPQVVPARRKEPYYFANHFSKGEPWYRAHFPTELQLAAVRALHGRSITGEATPCYLFHPLSAKRARELVPNARLIVLLRDPVARAYSHYQHNIRLGLERLEFEAALDAEESRCANDRERLRDGEIEAWYNLQNYSYCSRGRYLEQLLEWERWFGRESMLVLVSEFLFRDTLSIYHRVLEHLGLMHWNLRDTQPRAVGNYYRNLVPCESKLRTYFDPHNRRLEEWLGEPLPWPSIHAPGKGREPGRS